MTLLRLFRDPVAVVLGGLGAGWAFLNVGVVHSFGMALWASAGPLFTLLSLGALTLPPHIPPETTTDYAIVAVGALFIAKVASMVWREFDKRLDFDIPKLR